MAFIGCISISNFSSKEVQLKNDTFKGAKYLTMALQLPIHPESPILLEHRYLLTKRG